MKLRKKLLEKSRLYAILDRKVAGKRAIAGLAVQLKKTGVDIVQYRDKASRKDDILRNAFLLKKIFTGSKTLLIINDYADVAKIVDSDGLHLGQADTSIRTARLLLGKDKLIGVSCHSLIQALKAQKEGADYLGVGPIFPTPTKPEYKPVGLALIKKIKAAIKIPFFAIGGIDLDNIEEVFAAGAERVAAARAILG